MMIIKHHKLQSLRTSTTSLNPPLFRKSSAILYLTHCVYIVLYHKLYSPNWVSASTSAFSNRCHALHQRFSLLPFRRSYSSLSTVKPTTFLPLLLLPRARNSGDMEGVLKNSENGLVLFFNREMGFCPPRIFSRRISASEVLLLSPSSMCFSLYLFIVW